MHPYFSNAAAIKPNNFEMNNMDTWPDVFKTMTVKERIAKIGDREKAVRALTADALAAWANCMAGFGPIPECFGDRMVEIGQFLGISMLPNDVMAFAKTLEPAK